MDKTVRRYYELKQKQKEIEQELTDLRGHILAHCTEQGVTETEAGSYRVKIVAQERREYDDAKLYGALPDPEVWRLLSRADPAKIAGLVKLNVINEEILRDTYTTKSISLLQVERK
ncbi:hypothetical protein [Cohnella candidum]|uniref:Uncharacterized protein n=1 Tax=Cohnella candidum TaxID=2674991 RepID=A0A3G3JTY9_9BACL|nr:hypothetical protein [Cohnella candidum]AYQ71686.1 hypothetical protein EAV92_03325 [Cohnella candidum]